MWNLGSCRAALSFVCLISSVNVLLWFDLLSLFLSVNTPCLTAIHGKPYPRGAATTNGPKANTPPAICQNSGGKLGGGSSRGLGGGGSCQGRGVFLPGVGGGASGRGLGGRPPRGEGGGGLGLG